MNHSGFWIDRVRFRLHVRTVRTVEQYCTTKSFICSFSSLLTPYLNMAARDIQYIVDAMAG